MKQSNYMSSNALIEFLKIGILSSELDVIANNTKKTAKTQTEKDWAKYMRMCSTMLQKICVERLECLDKAQRDSVERREEHNRMLFETTRAARTGTGRVEDRLTIDFDDYTCIAELALLACHACPQGKYVKDCEYRKMFHRLDVPVGREEVCEGECEFMTCNKPKILLPQGTNDKEAQEMLDNDERLFL